MLHGAGMARNLLISNIVLETDASVVNARLLSTFDAAPDLHPTKVTLFYPQTPCKSA